jgi:transcriptional regulator with XRE-family HTH domain
MTRQSYQVIAGRTALGGLLTQHRERGGLSQRELAMRTHYHRTTISKLEAGTQLAPREFWCTADEVLGADGDLVAAFDELAAMKACSRGADSTDVLVDSLNTTLLPPVADIRQIRSAPATPNKIEIVIEFEALSRALTESAWRMLICDEHVDWLKIAGRLRAVTTMCERQVVMESRAVETDTADSRPD